MGDVALTVPVLRGVLNAYPHAHITILTRKLFDPFFSSIERLEVYSPKLSTRHRGFFGLLRLYRDLKKNGEYSMVIDLHSVLRTQILSFLFKLSGTRRFGIKKNRKLKKSYLRKSEAPNLTHTLDRYLGVFILAGYTTELMKPPVFAIPDSISDDTRKYIAQNHLKNKKLIGIAPYAKHELKIWPQKHVYDLINQLRKKGDVEILLFGGGAEELDKLGAIVQEFPECHIVDTGLRQQMDLIRKLSLMISMDSANLHLAALSNIPVISIWGATHPGMGFSAWKQDPLNTIQINVQTLECRPCTIFGKGICRRGDFACMERIECGTVLKRIEEVL